MHCAKNSSKSERWKSLGRDRGKEKGEEKTGEMGKERRATKHFQQIECRMLVNRVERVSETQVLPDDKGAV